MSPSTAVQQSLPPADSRQQGAAAGRPARARQWLARITLLCLCVFLAPVVRSEPGDPSGRVARLNHSRGDVSYSPAGADDWLQATRNRPVVAGDRLWTGRGARVELQVGSASVRMGPDTSLEWLELDDRFAQLRMAQGTLNLTVRHLHEDQEFEIATPDLVFTTRAVGRYRIDFEPDTQQTTITVWRGQGDAWGDGEHLRIPDSTSVRFHGRDLVDRDGRGLPRTDAFDRYCLERDRLLERSVSLQYLDDETIGYLDLDEHGRWRNDRDYGPVWYPNRVSSGWAPFRDGHWVWQEPWGWTWVDDAAWGFAPSHYGRWIHRSGRWGWIPGPRRVRPIYAPALVVFVGGSNWRLSVSFGNRAPIGWFPLGPSEPYFPAYRASRDYFTRVNTANTVITTVTINNQYNVFARGQLPTGRTYANRNVQGALTAVPGDVFGNARPVRDAMITLDQQAISSAPMARTAAVAPSLRSVLGPERAARARPEPAVLERSVVVRTPPPARAAAFPQRSRDLEQTPGLVPEHRSPAPGSGSADEARRNVRVLRDVQKEPTPVERGRRDPETPQPGNRPLDPRAPQALPRQPVVTERRDASMPAPTPRDGESVPTRPVRGAGSADHPGTPGPILRTPTQEAPDPRTVRPDRGVDPPPAEDRRGNLAPPVQAGPRSGQLDPTRPAPPVSDPSRTRLPEQDPPEDADGEDDGSRSRKDKDDRKDKEDRRGKDGPDTSAGTYAGERPRAR